MIRKPNGSQIRIPIFIYDYFVLLLFYDMWYKPVFNVDACMRESVFICTNHVHPNEWTVEQVKPIRSNINSLMLTSTWNLFIGTFGYHFYCVWLKTFISFTFIFMVMATAKIIANISTLIDESHTISINPCQIALVFLSFW